MLERLYVLGNGALKLGVQAIFLDRVDDGFIQGCYKQVDWVCPLSAAGHAMAVPMAPAPMIVMVPMIPPNLQLV